MFICISDDLEAISDYYTVAIDVQCFFKEDTVRVPQKGAEPWNAETLKLLKTEDRYVPVMIVSEMQCWFMANLWDYNRMLL